MLRREKIGELSLGDLKEGKYRELTKEEIEYLYSV
jgi:pseudouridylate synthase